MQTILYTFRLSETLENHISAPAVRKVYRTRIPENTSTSGAKGMRVKSDLYNPLTIGNNLKLTHMVRLGNRTHRLGYNGLRILLKLKLIITWICMSDLRIASLCSRELESSYTT